MIILIAEEKEEIFLLVRNIGMNLFEKASRKRMFVDLLNTVQDICSKGLCKKVLSVLSLINAPSL